MTLLHQQQTSTWSSNSGTQSWCRLLIRRESQAEGVRRLCAPRTLTVKLTSIVQLTEPVGTPALSPECVVSTHSARCWPSGPSAPVLLATRAIHSSSASKVRVLYQAISANHAKKQTEICKNLFGGMVILVFGLNGSISKHLFLVKVISKTHQEQFGKSLQ